MDDPGGIILKLILLLLLILVNAFFAMSEIAVISLNDNKIEKMAEDGHKKAKQVVKLTENSSKFLSTIQIGVTLAGFLTSASASQTFADMIVKALKGTAFYNALGASVVSGLSIVIITIIMSYFSLVRRACSKENSNAVSRKDLLQGCRNFAFLLQGLFTVC